MFFSNIMATIKQENHSFYTVKVWVDLLCSHNIFFIVIKSRE